MQRHPRTPPEADFRPACAAVPADFLLGRAINRIRHRYIEHAGDTERNSMLSGTTTQPE